MPEKRAIAMNAFHRGYMAPKSSLIETSSVARVTQPNDSELFMLMHEVTPDDPRYGTPLNGPNLWPAELPGFREPVQAYGRAMHDFCHRLLRPLARALGLPRETFERFFHRPTTFLRLLHYPPQAAERAGRRVRLGAAHGLWFYYHIGAGRSGRTGGAAYRR